MPTCNTYFLRSTSLCVFGSTSLCDVFLNIKIFQSHCLEEMYAEFKQKGIMDTVDTHASPCLAEKYAEFKQAPPCLRNYYYKFCHGFCFFQTLMAWYSYEIITCNMFTNCKKNHKTDNVPCGHITKSSKPTCWTFQLCTPSLFRPYQRSATSSRVV